MIVICPPDYLSQYMVMQGEARGAFLDASLPLTERSRKHQLPTLGRGAFIY